MSVSKRRNPPAMHEPFNMRGGVSRNIIISFLVIALTAGILGLILLSPLLLRQMGGLGGEDWARLSNIGQTYGAASAVLSALAVGGVVVSLFLQASQGRANQVQMVREYQRDLVRIMLDDPELYLPCWRSVELPDLDINARRQHLFSMLRMNFGQMGYEVGIVSEPALRGDLLEGMFQGTAGREYWMDARYRRSLNRNARARRFWSIVDDEYKKAVAAGPPIMGRTLDNAAQGRQSRDIHHPSQTPLSALLGIGAGVLLGIALRRKLTE
jgi:Family of unknown function (DUF6082)